MKVTHTLRTTEPAETKKPSLGRGESPHPTPILKLCSEADCPVYKLLLFGQPVEGFCSCQFPEFTFGSGWRGRAGGASGESLPSGLLDLLGQLWAGCAVPWWFVFSSGTDPAGAREAGARGMWSLGFGPASGTRWKSRGMGCQFHGKQGIGTEA